MSHLEFAHVHVRLGGARILNGVSMSAKAGEFIGLLGPNGAGKSTLLRAALGLVPCEGSILVAGQPSPHLKAAERARLIAYIAQEREVAWPVSVETLVALGRSPHRGQFARLSTADLEAVGQAMMRMDVAHLRKRLVPSLSGGERARVLIARALAQETPVLLADEPAAGLDPAHQLALIAIFRELASEGRTVVASMHELTLAAQGCGRIVLMNGGEIIADGSPRSALTEQTLAGVYGITASIAEGESGLLIAPTGLKPPVRSSM
jgi:iron complex transport system ATP-binding protein